MHSMWVSRLQQLGLYVNISISVFLSSFSRWRELKTESVRLSNHNIAVIFVTEEILFLESDTVNGYLWNEQTSCFPSSEFLSFDFSLGLVSLLSNQCVQKSILVSYVLNERFCLNIKKYQSENYKLMDCLIIKLYYVRIDTTFSTINIIFTVKNR